MKLWVDDTRDPAIYWAEGFTWVTSVEAAMDVLSLGSVTFASLDHDIGKLSGLDLVRWMRERAIWPRDGVRVHSATAMCDAQGVNGRDAMNAIVDAHYPQALTAFYKADRNENGAYFTAYKNRSKHFFEET